MFFHASLAIPRKSGGEVGLEHVLRPIEGAHHVLEGSERPMRGVCRHALGLTHCLNRLRIGEASVRRADNHPGLRVAKDGHRSVRCVHLAGNLREMVAGVGDADCHTGHGSAPFGRLFTIAGYGA